MSPEKDKVGFSSVSTMDLNRVLETMEDIRDKTEIIRSDVNDLKGQMGQVKDHLGGNGSGPLGHRIIRLEERLKSLEENQQRAEVASEKAQAKHWQIWLAIIVAVVSLIGAIAGGAVTLLKRP